MGIALRKIMQEDPSFRFSYNEETGQTVISGMGELHLEIIVDRLRREHKVEVVQGKLQVAYKETIQKPVEVEGKFISQSGGRGQYGHVWIKFEPLERGKGFDFENKVVGGTIPREYIPGVEKGFEEAITSGVLGGYPVLILRRLCMMVHTMMLTLLKLHLKLLHRWHLRAGCAKASPVFLSQS